MPLYHLPAIGEPGDPEGIRPNLGDLVAPQWSGMYDEASNSYVIKTPDDAPIAGLTPLTEGQDVGFDYSAMAVPPGTPAGFDEATGLPEGLAQPETPDFAPETL